MLCKINAIQDRYGRDKLDDRNIDRLDREGHLLQAVVGFPMVFQFDDDLRMLVTSEVDRVMRLEHGMAVRTKQSIYYLSAVEDDPEYPECPELIDREVEP